MSARPDISILEAAKPCPFCGSKDLRVTDWWDETGMYDAVECNTCFGCAPANNWNRRTV